MPARFMSYKSYRNNRDTRGNNRDMFEMFKTSESSIRVGDRRELKSHRLGTVKLRLRTNDEIIELFINDTLFVPDLNVNLISISKLAKRGYSISLNNSEYEIMFEKELVAKGSFWQKNSYLYELKVYKDENDCAFITNVNKES